MVAAMSSGFHSAVEQFLEHLRIERNYSPHTLRNYRIDLEAFIHFVNSAGIRNEPAPPLQKFALPADYRTIKKAYRSLR